MATPKGDWVKSRSKSQHLTAQEIEKLKAAFLADRPSKEIAEEMQLSWRAASRYYGLFRAEGLAEEAVSVAIDTSPAPNTSRFYTSTFEL